MNSLGRGVVVASGWIFAGSPRATPLMGVESGWSDIDVGIDVVQGKSSRLGTRISSLFPRPDKGRLQPCWGALRIMNRMIF